VLDCLVSRIQGVGLAVLADEPEELGWHAATVNQQLLKSVIDIKNALVESLLATARREMPR
jgi:hypothetical protein